MKKTIALTLFSLAAALPTQAQWVVFDPALQTQSILNTAQEIAKFVEVVNNQVQQIQALTDQLNQFKHYESLFGDPKSIILPTAKALTDELRQTEVGRSLDTFMRT